MEVLNWKVKKVEIKNPSDAVACGFALVPEDRRKEGLVLSHTIKENAILRFLPSW